VRLGLLCATALLLSACGGGAAALSPVKITLKVEDASLRKVGDACSGSGGYLYVRPGAAYEVAAGGQVLARGALPPGVAVRRGANAIKGAAVEPTTCTVSFSVRLPSRARYTLRLDRGAQFSFSAARAVSLVASAASSGRRIAAPPQKAVSGTLAGLPGPVPAGAKLAPEDTSAPKAPDFQFTTLGGKTVSGSSLWAVRPVVVAFTASWCARCPAQQPMLNDLAKRYAGLIAFVGVAQQDKAADLERYAITHAVPYAVGIDSTGGSWRSYTVDEPPVIAVIGKGGRLLRGWNVDVDEATVDGVLKTLASR
jgi:thiol-disulfide isomerase/thioredoxin